MKPVYRGVVSATLLVFLLTACSLGGQTPTPTPVPPGATPAVPLPTAQPSDPCANEYFPVKNNATFNYSSTGSPSGPYSFTNTITNVRPDGFTLSSQIKKLPIVQEWSCTPQGLVATQLGANNATSMLAFEKFTDLKASNISGVILPPTITSGAEWAYALDIQGTEKVTSGTPATMTGRMSVTYTAGNKESVTVPAGTFDTISIEVNTVIDFNVITAGGNTVKLSVDSTYTIWYAPGVGWVKSSGSGKLGGQDYFETIVLDSYTIP